MAAAFKTATPTRSQTKNLTRIMEVWLLILLTLSTLILTILHLGKNRRLQPGPAAVPIIGNLLWLRRRPIQNIEPLLRELHAKYGPVVTLRIGSSRAIFISDRALTHKALVEHGATFSDRPAPHPSIRFLSSNQHNIISAGYGPLWRLLRRKALVVRHQGVQKKLAEEIESVVGREADEVKEDELQRMPYLKAVIMEGLRRHPPGHLVHPHSVTQEIEIGGYVIPKKASVNFMVAEMNWDGKVWEDPMEFRPERFMVGGEGEGVDITGTREIKMMPFGVGRRICSGLGVAMLHLEYFVANLVRDFEWKSVEGVEVDIAEKAEFTVVMKKPLSACLLPRRREMR